MSSRHRLMLWLAEHLILWVADRSLSDRVDNALRHALADIQRAR